MYTPTDPLLMIPGPTPVSAAVRAALAAPVRGHATPQVAESIRRIREALRVVVGAPGADVYVLPGSGTLAMEAAVVNHVAPGDRVVVVNHGYFADRFTEVCACHGIEVDEVRAEWGRVAEVEEVRAALGRGGAALLIVTHVDTSTGTMAPVLEYARAAGEVGTMVLLDGVCATAGVEESLEAWGVDLLVTASQKALAVPPGLAIVIGSQRARQRREGGGVRPGYFIDLRRWDAPMAGPAYFATHASSMLRALETSLAEILAEGLEARYQRHRQLAAATREGFASMGFSPVTDPAALAPTLSVMRPPAGVDEGGLRARMLAAGVLVAGGIGPLAGQAIRVGHMGSVGQPELELTLATAAAALEAS